MSKQTQHWALLSVKDLICIVILLICVSFFTYHPLYTTAVKNIKYFRLLKNENKAECLRINDLKNEEEKLKKELESESKKTESIDTVPMFLIKLNQELRSSKTELESISKSENEKFAYKLLTYASFSTLLDFMFRIEKSNLAFKDIDIHPYTDDKNHINLDLKLIKDKLKGKDLISFINQQKKYPHSKQLRNPFQEKRTIIVSTGKSIRKPCNLSYSYKLSGIGILEGKKYATIDHNDYFVGDTLNKMDVLDIKSDRVIVKRRNRECYISFQRGKKTNHTVSTKSRKYK